jgi:branched-chain amino acid transport system ATP-binding protein
MTGSPLLELRGVSAGYGGGSVIHDITVDVFSGDTVAILGPNGAGKTSILNAITSQLTVAAGSVHLAGREITRIRTDRVVREGIAYVPQGRGMFPYSTGLENLRIGGFSRDDRSALEADIRRFVAEWPIAERVLHRKAALMSGGEQQVVAVGRALMSRPTVLLLDEPTLGLAPILVTQLFEMIAALADDFRERGGALVIVEQNIVKALEIANRVYVVVEGRIVHEALGSDLSAQTVAQLYFGGTPTEKERR